MRELIALTAILAQDAFWLMDKLGDRTLDKMRARWLKLAEQHGWVDVRESTDAYYN